MRSSPTRELIVFFHHPEGLPRIVAVDQPHPHAPSLAYTESAWPELGSGLVTFDRDARLAADLLRAVGHLPVSVVQPDRWVVMDELERGAIVRFRACDPDTLDRFLLARTDAGRRAPYLQVAVVHDDRRLSERLDCDCCPNLNWSGEILHSGPFETASLPIGDRVRVLPTSTARACVITVEIPVRVADAVEPRRETLLAEEVDGGARLLQSPVLADWTAAGAVMGLSDPPHGIGIPVADRIIRSSRHVQLGVELERSGLVARHRDAVHGAVEKLLVLGDVAVTNTGRWLSASVPEGRAERGRSVLRRLVRDGHAHEVGSYSNPSPGRCTCCVAGGS